MKPKLLVPRCYARAITSPEEVDRLLAGDYLLAAPKARTKSAGRMRKLRNDRREAGWLSLYIWLDPEQVAAVTSAMRPGESYAELLVRLIEERSLLH